MPPKFMSSETTLPTEGLQPIDNNCHSQSFSQSWLSDVMWLTLGLIVLYSILLGHRPLSVPDEARYAEIPREMVALGNYITPHLNFVKYFEKPALFYWLQAGAIKLWGLNELAVRIPNTAMAILGCLFTYGTGRLLYNRRVGIVASLILASASLYFVMGHLVTIDMTMATLLSGSLLCFLAGLRATHSQRLAFYGFYAFAALAVLTKGLIGLIFPAMIIGTWILIFNEWRLLRKIYLPTGILLFLAIAAPWHILVQWQNPEFFHFYFMDQQFLRYFTNIANRSQPPGFFVAALLIGFLPWSVFILQALYYNLPKRWQDRSQNRFTVFLLLWFTLIFAFFSFSHSQLIPYILPVFSPLAVLLARYLVDQWDQPQPLRGTKIGYTVLPVLIFLAGVGAFVVNYYHHILVLTAIQNQLAIIAGTLLIGSTCATYFIRRNLAKAAFSALLISAFCSYFVVLIAMPLADTRSIQPLANIIQASIKPGDEVATYENYYQDLPFYLRRRITIVDWQNELTFGMQHQDVSAWMLSPATFWQLWQSAKKVYMITDTDTYTALLKQAGQHKLILLAQSPGNVLLINHN